MGKERTLQLCLRATMMRSRLTFRRNSTLPLPTDQKLIALSQDLLQQLDTIFGLHPGFRPAHAKGTMLIGKFTPTLDAGSLTRAPHMNQDSTPVTVRFSNTTGVPLIP